MTISAATAPGENCTEDLLLEILLRLPVKSLHRFKAVSKTWLSLITSSSFVKSQLRHAITSKAGDDDKTVLVNLYKDENGESEDVSFALLRPSSGELVADLKLPYSEHDYPDVRRSFVVGSDIGVVCVVVGYNYDSYVLYLWNPATKQSKLIPELYVFERECFGFGFDPIDSDFKVVKTCMGQYTNEDYCSAVYSAKENSWRLKPSPPDVSTYDGYDVCLHGFLCSIGEHGMVAFDLNKEVFICNVKLPANDVSRAFRACLTDLKDSIAFVFSEDKGGKTNFWTLDDEACLAGNGLEASWTLMLSIDHVALPVQFVKGYIDVGDFKLVSEFKDRCLYNTYKNGAGKIRFSYETFKAFKYTETLVSIA